MKHDTAGARAAAWLATGTLALLPLGACGGDEENDPSASDGDSADVDDITDDDYFYDEEYIGETVTVRAEVTDVLSSASFELAGERYADETLLVLTDREVDVAEGEVVEVTGTVEEAFVYENYSDEYGLEEPETYDEFGDEEFLNADSVDTGVEAEQTDGSGNGGS